MHRVAHRLQPQATSDGKIPGSWWARPPPGNIHVGWAPRARVGMVCAEVTTVIVGRAEKRPLRQEARLLKLRMIIGSRSSKVHQIAEEVVTTRAVPTATADQGMVAEAVQDAVSARTVHILVGKRYA